MEKEIKGLLCKIGIHFWKNLGSRRIFCIWYKCKKCKEEKDDYVYI